jgi:hypothetical protein
MEKKHDDFKEYQETGKLTFCPYFGFKEELDERDAMHDIELLEKLQNAASYGSVVGIHAVCDLIKTKYPRPCKCVASLGGKISVATSGTMKDCDRLQKYQV